MGTSGCGRLVADTRNTPIGGVRPSAVTVPQGQWAQVLDFMVAQFPNVPISTWRQRFAEGRILGDDGQIGGTGGKAHLAGHGVTILAFPAKIVIRRMGRRCALKVSGHRLDGQVSIRPLGGGL